MACDSTSVCFESFVDLCSNVGQTCFQAQTFWDLISNQSRLADQLAPVIDGVDGVIASCSRVYLDTASCSYTGVASATTVAVGVHAFGGRVMFDGNVRCVNVLPTSGVFPTCGTLLDDTFTADANGSWLLLEDASGDGCHAAMKLGAETEDIYIDEVLAGLFSVTSSASTVVGTVTVPNQTGRYVATIDVRSQSPTPEPSEDVVLTLVDSSNAIVVEGRATRSRFPRITASREFCLTAGDTLTLQAAQSGTTASSVFQSRVQLRYVGDC